MTSDYEEYQICPVVIDGVEWNGVFIWFDGCAYLGHVTHAYRLAEGWAPANTFVEPYAIGNDFVAAPNNWRELVLEQL
jgi:hypothetical protein